MSSLVLGVFLLKHWFTSAAEVPDVVTIRSGHDAILPCRGPTAASITLLEWSRIEPAVDGCVYFYRDNRSFQSYQHLSYRGRVELKEALALKDGDVSVVLRNATVLDSGTYKCRVATTELEGGRKKNVELSSLVQLTVTDSGGTEELRERSGDKEGGDEEAGEKDTRDKERGDEEGNSGRDVALTASLFVVAFAAVVVAVGVLFYRKKRLSDQSSYKAPPPDEELRSNEV